MHELTYNACYLGHYVSNWAARVERVQVLIENGANVNATNDEGDTPFINAGKICPKS